MRVSVCAIIIIAHNVKSSAGFYPFSPAELLLCLFGGGVDAQKTKATVFLSRLS